MQEKFSIDMRWSFVMHAYRAVLVKEVTIFSFVFDIFGRYCVY